MVMTDYTQQRYKKVMDDYLIRKGTISLTKLCKEHDCDRGEVSMFMRKRGVNIINYQNRDKFNTHIFDNIDTEEKAYWLGFLYADGSIGSGVKNSIEISLKLSDAPHLEKFRQFLKAETKVKTDHFRCRIYVSNKTVAETLSSYGCTPKKSLTLKFPSIITTSLLRHFIRGYVDGDGCLYKSYSWNRNKTKKKFYIGFSVLGTKEFLLVLRGHLGITSNLYRKNNSSKNTWSLITLRTQAFKIAAYLYENCTIYLDRKFDIYKKWKYENRS